MKSGWDVRWLGLAAHVASWSKDPSTKVGAVAVSKDQRLLSMGWNGFPRGFQDRPELYADREYKYDYVVHAEKNCVYNAAREGVSLIDSTMYVHGMLVCSQCALGVRQCGVSRVVIATPDVDVVKVKWLEEFEKSGFVFYDGGISFDVFVIDDGHPQGLRYVDAGHFEVP